MVPLPMTFNLDFRVTGLLLMHSTYCVRQFTRHLFAIAKLFIEIRRFDDFEDGGSPPS